MLDEALELEQSYSLSPDDRGVSLVMLHPAVLLSTLFRSLRFLFQFTQRSRDGIAIDRWMSEPVRVSRGCSFHQTWLDRPS